MTSVAAGTAPAPTQDLFGPADLDFETLFTFGSAGYGCAEFGELVAVVNQINAAGASYQTYYDASFRPRQSGFPTAILGCPVTCSTSRCARWAERRSFGQPGREPRSTSYSVPTNSSTNSPAAEGAQFPCAPMTPQTRSHAVTA